MSNEYSIPNSQSTVGNLSVFGSLPTQSLYNPNTGTGAGPIAYDPRSEEHTSELQSH